MISVFGLIMVLMSAAGFYTIEKNDGRTKLIYALMLFFSVMHIAGDGVFRALISDPANIAVYSLSGWGIFYFIIYITGAAGVLNMTFDLVISMVMSDKLSRGKWILIHIPVPVILLFSFIFRNGFGTALIKYMPLIYTVVLFFITIWFIEKIDQGLKNGLICSMIISVLVFIAGNILRIGSLPLMIPVVSVLMAVSWTGRGVTVSGDMPSYEADTSEEKASSGRTYVFSGDESEDEEELSEMERMMRMSEAAKSEQLLTPDMEEEKVEELNPSPEVEFSGNVPTPLGDESVVTAEKAETETETPEIRVPLMRVIEPSPMEQLEAATVLVAESDTKSENAVQWLQQVDDNTSDVMHNRPLILEKDLNEFYHRMKVAVENKDYDTCLEIMSDMSEYRISGIHLTRYERIRHAVVDEEWKVVEKELVKY